jgi:O-antigen/teichoic acid export membrane protein
VSSIKSLAGQTAIYGVPSILGRILGYLLVPLYTRVFAPGEYGTVNVFYSYASFLMVILTYGMETAFFRFNVHEKDKESVFSTVMISLLSTSVLFLAVVTIFSPGIARAIDYPKHSNYVTWFAWILTLDALASIPFAKLRARNRPRRFATIKLTGILVNIGLNLILILLIPWLARHVFHGPSSGLRFLSRPGWGIEYIFISNLIASGVTLVLLLPEITSITLKLIDWKLLRKMLIYAFPLLFAGMAGIVNETFDRLLLRYLLPAKVASYQVGIYAACYKISILMTIFIQAYRYAAEPFFFSKAKDKDARVVYARIMDYFIITVSFLFLVTMVYLNDFVLQFLGKKYWSGRGVIPILMLANLFLGVYYNLSIWYKLTNKTIWGAWLALAGAVITLVLNFWWIPLSSDHLIHGYYGSAWATFICYAAMMVLSYIIGQKFYPINYNLIRILGYLSFAVILWILSIIIKPGNAFVSFAYHTLLVLIFAATAVYIENRQLIRKLFFPPKDPRSTV